ncbi:hypothetical protein EX30DRAFT_301111 [Ascodesmis nigricans]|uniref:FZ domain-containing protein n=1 Tax=Ascodesmis nigricans TaxID=341454 RepID=A0A4S2N6P3_9PEZI|nr:hypothetical protein EX30DRAFT_301111 [Ascodesmis nigricans]
MTDDEATPSKLPEPKRVRLTFNTCKQPLANKTDYPDGWKAPLAPQLIVYVSNTTENQSPGPNVQGKAQMKVEIDHGWGELEFDASSDIFIGVSAPDLPDSEVLTTWQHDPPWNYELAVTTGQPYHGFVNDQFLYLVDTDDTAALMITGNLTSESALYGGVNETLSGEELMKITKFPYTMYAQRTNPLNPMPFEGIEKSYCAVRQLAQSKPGQADISMTTRGLGNFPKQQFHLKELKGSSEYLGFLTRPRNVSDSSDTGGTVWAPTAFHTKADGNCKIIYNLPFCAEVAYAVPANPTVFSDTRDLTDFYDDIAERWWKNFTYSLQQVQCNASSSAAYSLVRNCDSCAASYKNWLCAVTIPRCMDYSSKLSYLAPRSENRLFWNATAPGWQERPYTPVVEKDDIPMNVTGPRNRNSLVDEVVMPGRYKEVKPCKDLCWSLVQDCPSSMGFGCPEMGSEGGQESYGERDPSGDVTCSYLGAVYFLNDAWRKGVGVWWWGLLLAAVLWELV